VLEHDNNYVEPIVVETSHDAPIVKDEFFSLVTMFSNSKYYTNFFLQCNEFVLPFVITILGNLIRSGACVIVLYYELDIR